MTKATMDKALELRFRCAISRVDNSIDWQQAGMNRDRIAFGNFYAIVMDHLRDLGGLSIDEEEAIIAARGTNSVVIRAIVRELF